jgi:hypothetical protein
MELHKHIFACFPIFKASTGAGNLSNPRLHWRTTHSGPIAGCWLTIAGGLRWVDLVAEVH